MDKVAIQCRVLVQEYLSVTRRVSELVREESREVREFAENLMCKGF